MDEYKCDIHIPDGLRGWKFFETKDVNAFDESGAKTATENYCYNKYFNYRVVNIRLIKKFINVDGEI